MEKTAVTRDSAIQRFEFTVDLAWKAVKAYLEEKKGVVCTSPKECLKDAFQNGLIEHDEFWLSMIDLRNETSHTYRETFAEEVYDKLSRVVDYCERLLAALSS